MIDVFKSVDTSVESICHVGKTFEQQLQEGEIDEVIFINRNF